MGSKAYFREDHFSGGRPNCVVGLFDGKSETATSVEALQELMRYALSGVINLAVTTRVEVDLGRDKDDERRKAMLHHLGMMPVIGTVGRWGQSKFDGGDVFVGPEQQALLDEVQRILSPGLSPESSRYPNKLADIDHLVGHKLAGRDVFVTDDKGILRRYPELRDGPGILVMSPEECLRYVDGHYARHEKKMLEPAAGDAAYWDKRLTGRVSFDYSNNNGRMTIGEGLNLFETQWSKASDTAIHAYHDAGSIEAVAIAKGASEIRDIVDATAYDFTSRSRTIGIGEIALWRNTNGLYAATKVAGIQDDSRGAARDELVFEFVILAAGTADFSGG